MRQPEEFTIRSGTKTLPASSGPTEPIDVLRTEAQGAAWRLIELCSASQLPFDAYLSWSSGSGSISTARLTVATGTRVCSRSMRSCGMASRRRRISRSA